MRSTRRPRTWIAGQRFRPQIIRLENRVVPSGTGYVPPAHFLVNRDIGVSATTFDSSRSLDVATAYLNAHAAELGLDLADVAQPFVTSQYTDRDTGFTHLYLRQNVNGMQVANADFSMSIAPNGVVFSAAGGFVPDLSDQLDLPHMRRATMTPAYALQNAAIALGIISRGETIAVDGLAPDGNTFMLAAAALSLDPIPLKLHYVPTDDGSAVVAWDMIVRTPDNQHWYSMSIGDTTGSIVSLTDWMDVHATYNAVPLPNEHPLDGGFAVVTNPEDPTASPFGWHDTNGVAGAEFTDTRGNNVDAHLDRNNDNVADATPPRPSGGASLDFSGFIFDPLQQPTVVQNQNAVVVNLFYMNNMLHDIHYQYGFTEVAGNFQVNNYGLGGTGNDAVQADAQDGGGTNNANFATPVDGLAPRMQMYLFTGATPQRDGDLDNGIVIHEYGHGVSNRLTGGPANSNALSATQSGGMGEGWSDFYAIMLTQRPTDLQNDAVPIGTYALNQPPTGPGIRRRPYSYDLTIDPLDFDAYGTSGTTSYGIARSTQVHNSGELWCSTLWDLNWLLINKYGFDANLHTGWTPSPGPGNAGNKLTLKLVMEGMKLQPALPSFIDARDAIIAADMALNGGADLLEIWTAFARRGLGENAATLNANATTITLDYTIPPAVLGLVINSSTPALGSVVITPPVSFDLFTDDTVDPATVDASDLKVNGIPADFVAYTAGSTSMSFTFNTNPVVAEGLHTMQVLGGAFERASDNKAVIAYTAGFRYDILRMQVDSTGPAVGSGISLPLTTLDVNLNEAVAPASVSTGDLTLSQGTVSGFTLLNSNTTIRFTLSGINAEGTLNVGIAAGALADANGNPNVVFSGSYALDIGTVALVVPLTGRSPLGSLVYDSSATGGVIAPASDTDSFTVTIDAGQTITVLVTPTAPALQPTVELRNPLSVLIGTATAPAAGKKAVVNAVAATTAGTYAVTVVGAGGTAGSFTVQVTLNAALENENADGAINNTLATAQNIGPSFINVQTALGSASRGAIVGRLGIGPNGASEDFELGVLPASISTYTSNSFGRIRVIAPGGSGNSSAFAVLMDSNADANYALNEATYTVDLTGATEANLSFAHINFNDEPEALPSSFTGHLNGDGVSFSADGVTWRTLLSAPTQTVWTTFSVDLAAAAAAAGVPLGPNFKIKFQQYDNYTATTDGRAYDNIVIAGSEEDWNRIDLAAGDRVTVALKSLSGSSVNLSLVDSTNATLATGLAGPSNFDKLINNYAVLGAGAYYLKVTGGQNTDYSLVINTNAAFDQESNSTAATAQALADTRGVLGSVLGGSGTSVFDLTGPTVTGPVILSGTKVTLGFHADGSFVTASGGTGIKFNGTEFVVPGTPLASFTVGYNGTVFTNNGANLVTQIAGVTLRDISSGSVKGLRIVGVAGGTVQVERVVLFNQSDEFVTIATRLTNLSGASISNVATLENIDPDQDFGVSSAYNTANDVVLSGQFVHGFGAGSNLAVGLGSTDVSSVVSAEGFDNRDPFAIINSPTDPGGASADIAIAQAFNFGTLGAGNQVSAIALMAFGTGSTGADTTFAANSAGTAVSDTDWYSITMPAGQVTLSLETSTPGDAPGQIPNTLDPDIQLFDASGTTMLATGSALPDGRNEALFLGGLTPGATYLVRVSAGAASKGEYFLGLTTSDVVPPTVSDVVINDGDAPRSRVTSVAVSFDQTVTFSGSPVDAFELKRQSDDETPTLAADVDDTGLFTIVTLTFSGTTAVDFESLADGRYTLTIDATQVSNINGQLDGNGNGVGGDDYVVVGDPTAAPFLFRLYGDIDGDGTVAVNDFNEFRFAFGGTNADFDFDNDGSVGNSDFNQFRSQFGSSV